MRSAASVAPLTLGDPAVTAAGSLGVPAARQTPGRSGAGRRAIGTNSVPCSPEDMARRFDALAPSWDRKHGPIGLRQLALVVRTAYLNCVCADLARPRVLDVGCGTGQQLFALADRLAEGVGIDISPAMVAQARANARLRRLDDRLTFDVAAAEQLCPEQFGTFGLILCVAALEHMADPQVVLARIVKLLRPQGVFVLVTADPWHPRSLYARVARTFGLIPPFRHLTWRGVKQCALTVGLRPMDVAGVITRQRPCATERLDVQLLPSMARIVMGSCVAAFTAEAAEFNPRARHMVGDSRSAAAARPV